MRFAWIVAAFALLSTSATAEVEKTVLVCESSMCLYRWPKLTYSTEIGMAFGSQNDQDAASPHRRGCKGSWAACA
jgi:hypothetical protein